MRIFSDIWSDLFGPKKWNHPDHVEVPKLYRAQVRAAFWTAAAKLESVGLYLRKHKIREIEIRKGEVIRPQGWAIASSASPTGYAGELCGSRKITLVADPDTGAVNDKTIIHGWAHALMDYANVHRGNAHEQHKIMARAGI